MRFLSNKNNYKYYNYKMILWILPFIHLFFSIIIKYKFGYFFLNITDPEYFHLFSDAAIGGGCFKFRIY